LQGVNGSIGSPGPICPVTADISIRRRADLHVQVNLLFPAFGLQKIERQDVTVVTTLDRLSSESCVRQRGRRGEQNPRCARRFGHGEKRSNRSVGQIVNVTRRLGEERMTRTRLMVGAALAFALSGGMYAQAAMPDGCQGKAPKIAEGNGTIANSQSRLAEGNGTVARLAEGNGTVARLAEGNGTVARLAEGKGPVSRWAEGNGTQARLAEGNGTVANAQSRLAEGNGTVANAQSRLAEGNGAVANAQSRWAEGNGTIANQQARLAEGNGAVARLASADPCAGQ
jgi:hypothetical protein